MKLILAALIWTSSSVFAFENNCRVDATSNPPTVVIDGRRMQSYIFLDEAYYALERMRVAGVCSPSNCTIGKLNTSVTLIVDGRETGFIGSLGEALSAFANWKAAHFCDIETAKNPSENL